MAPDWLVTEREVCRLLGAEHVGGRGQPDCRRGAAVIEVKDHRRKVCPDVIRRTMKKPWARGLPLIVVSRSGFSDRAVQFAREHAQVFLYEADLAGQKVRQIWPEVDVHRPEPAQPGVPLWRPVAALGGLAAVAGGVFLAVKYWAPPPPK
jgi:hypothetical protein